MRLLLAGDWRYDWYEPACAEALQRLGVEVMPCGFARFFQGYAGWRYLGKIEGALPVLPGPALFRLNFALYRTVKTYRPDWVLIWRGTHVLPSTLRLVRRHTGARLVSYNNDDPFGPRLHANAPWHHHALWQWYVAGLKEFDVNFVFRRINVGEVTAAGGRNVSIMMPYFVPWLHRPLQLSREDRRRYECDVVFVGHYEPDARDDYIRVLLKAGLRVRVFGGEYWNRWAHADLQRALGAVRCVYGDEYAKALSGAKMALGLLSRLNRDTYTRRHFEIPACGALLVSERTSDLQCMFKDGEDAVFFSSTRELVDRVRELLAAPGDRARIQENGRRRVWQDGHDVVSRMHEFVRVLDRA